MARSNSSNNSVKYLAGSVAVVAVAFCIGYFVIGGSRPQPTPPENVVPPNVAAPAAPAPAKPAIIARAPRTQNGEYTAPGAPRIRIVEERNPSLLDTSKMQPKPAAKSSDSEASQEAAPTPKTVSTVISPTDAGSDSTDNTAPNTDTAPPDGGTPSPTVTGTNPDPDTEKVSGTGAGEVGQDGVSSKTQFRVQAGSFVASENAKALADALRRRGYVTSTRAERDGDRTVYKVQVGAYRTKSAADKAAQDLQSSGYPASVSPTSP